MYFQQMELALEFSLSGNAEQDSRLLPLARILPGFDEESLRQGICRIRLPLDKSRRAGELRDVLFDLWSMGASLPDAKLTLDREALGLEELKQLLRVMDCAASHYDASIGSFSTGC
jgi:hypothetical protein